MTDQDQTASGNEKKSRHRSPNYPAVGLRDACDRAAKLYNKDGKAGAPPELAAVHIGFSKPHGQAMSVLAALKKFGLVAESNGRVIPTQRALEIVNLPSEDPRRLQALQDAALSPPVYQELIGQHKQTGWPADDVLERELVTYRNFNPNAVKGFVEDLKDSLEFAGLSDLSALESNAEEEKVQREAAIDHPDTVGAMFSKELERGRKPGEALAKTADRMRGAPLLAQTLAISIPRDLRVEIGVCGDELKKEDLARIKSQFNRWIEGLEEAFKD
jgi:hypothetical protein